MSSSFTDLSDLQTQDSPSVSTPNTAPPSPSSVEDSKFLRSEGKNEEKKKSKKIDFEVRHLVWKFYVQD